jgi:hypothetical protein
MFRKRKQPSPEFRLPPPYQPVTGDQASMLASVVFPYCAMFQIAEADTHINYVICRGHDTRHNKFYNSIAVAKPYSSRRIGAYQVAQIYPAALPLQGTHAHRTGWHAPTPDDVLWRVGQNPGVAVTSQGHPADLQEEVEILKTDEGVHIDWMLLQDPPPPELVELCLKVDHPGQATPFACYLGAWDPAIDDWDYSGCATEVTAIDHRWGVPYPDAGSTGLFTPRASEAYGTIYECVSLDCESKEACCSPSVADGLGFSDSVTVE